METPRPRQCRSLKKCQKLFFIYIMWGFFFWRWIINSSIRFPSVTRKLGWYHERGNWLRDSENDCGQGVMWLAGTFPESFAYGHIGEEEVGTFGPVCLQSTLQLASFFTHAPARFAAIKPTETDTHVKSHVASQSCTGARALNKGVQITKKNKNLPLLMLCY